MNQMKKFLVVMTAMAVIASLSACGNNETSEKESNSSKTESVADEDIISSSEGNKKKASDIKTESANLSENAEIGDCPALTIELKDGKVFKYNGECFTDVYQQLCDLGIEKEVTEGEYAEKGIFNSAKIEASNGTLFSISYLPTKQIFEIRTGEGVKNKTAWNLACGPIDNTTLIADFIKMGATPVEKKNAHSAGTHITDYYFESENFATKGVSINASGDGSPQEDELVVKAIIIDYSGVEA